MRIAIFTESFYPNKDGTAYTVFNHAINLIKRGHEVIIFAPNNKFKYYEELINGLKIYRLPSIPIFLYRQYRLSIPLYYKVKKILKDFNADAIHSHNPFSAGRLALRLAEKFSIPILGSCHHLPHNFLESIAKIREISNRKFLLNRIWSVLIKYYNRCNFVTLPSKFGLNNMKKMGLKVPSKVLSNGIDLNRFNLRNDPSELIKRYDIPDGKIVLHAGRLAGERKVDLIIKAAPLIIKKVPNTHFIIVGDGRERNNLQSFVKQLHLEKYFTFTSFLSHEDYPKIFPIVDVFFYQTLNPIFHTP